MTLLYAGSHVLLTEKRPWRRWTKFVRGAYMNTKCVQRSVVAEVAVFCILLTLLNIPSCCDRMWQAVLNRWQLEA